MAASQYDKYTRSNCALLLGQRNVPFFAELKNGKLPPSVVTFLTEWFTSAEKIPSKQMKQLVKYAEMEKKPRTSISNTAIQALYKG